MLKLDVSEGKTQIVAVSSMDLNAIYTPFPNPSIAKNVPESFTTKGNVIYFQPEGDQAFSIYITQKDDLKAPTYKLTLAPSPIPVGQQIKLIPEKPYISKKEQKKYSTTTSYPDIVISMLSKAAHMLADEDGKHKLTDFIIDNEFTAKSFYIGNALVMPMSRYVGSQFEIFILDVLNRSNSVLELVNSDFSEISPSTGLVDSEQTAYVAGVGFYPHQVLSVGGKTQVILVRSL
jgi:hypothetical protein